MDKASFISKATPLFEAEAQRLQAKHDALAAKPATHDTISEMRYISGQLHGLATAQVIILKRLNLVIHPALP